MNIYALVANFKARERQVCRRCAAIEDFDCCHLLPEAGGTTRGALRYRVAVNAGCGDCSAVGRF